MTETNDAKQKTAKTLATPAKQEQANNTKEKVENTMSSNSKLEEVDSFSTDQNAAAKKIQLYAEFSSFIELRTAIESYQKENSVQLIVKDSKLLKAESTRKIIPKVYHLVNQSLMYHSITYCCKCHGELKQKPGTRIKNVGQKRLNCPMYIRFKLSPDLQKLELFDIDETHNHGIDPTTFQMTPRQQIYKFSRMKRSGSSINDDDDDDEDNSIGGDGLIKYSKKCDTSPDYKPPRKSARIQAKQDDSTQEEPDECDENGHGSENSDKQHYQPDSPLDSESSCSDSDEEELRTHRALLPFPIRLIGSAIQSSPELLVAAKQLIQIQKSKLIIEKQKLILETKQLELINSKLELELRALERNLANEMTGSSEGRDTTIYLHAS